MVSVAFPGTFSVNFPVASVVVPFPEFVAVTLALASGFPSLSVTLPLTWAKDLKGTEFTFYPDPYPDQQLFYRSDNATLAALGVPAHTISTSKMDTEKMYHTQEDEIETLDIIDTL